MAIATYKSHVAKDASPYQRLFVSKLGAANLQFPLVSHWSLGAESGATPAAAAVPAQTIAGALGQFDTSGIQRLSCFEVAGQGSGTRPSVGLFLLADRLSHQGGLSGAVGVSEQTTNLPTAALTRYTDGEGVWAIAEVYSALGATTTTFTARYTNQAGTGSQVSQADNIGGSLHGAANRSILIPLAAGDTGIRSVEGVTIAVTTGGAGNFGITLIKPLALFAVQKNDQPTKYDAVLDSMLNYVKIENGACLCFYSMPSTPLTITGTLSLVEE